MNKENIHNTELRGNQDNLKIINNFFENIPSEKLLVLLDSGYAVEALMGGNITRKHDDVDFIFLKMSNICNDEIENIALKNVQNNFGKWESLETKPNWIWLQQNENIQNSFSNRINIHIIEGKKCTEGQIKLVSSVGNEFFMDIEKCYLKKINVSIDVLSPCLEFMVSSKIRLIEPYGNCPRQKDLYDIKRMMNSTSFSLEKSISILSEFYQNKYGLSLVESQKRALKEIYYYL